MEIPFVVGALAMTLALIVVAFKTFQNGSPTESIAQVLHDVEHPVPVPVPPVTGKRR